MLQDDPLTQTLDKLFSPELKDSVNQVPVNIPQGVKDICAELEQEEGIESVVLGRQVEEKRVVSQVLHLHSTAMLDNVFLSDSGLTARPQQWRQNLPGTLQAASVVACLRLTHNKGIMHTRLSHLCTIYPGLVDIFE